MKKSILLPTAAALASVMTFFLRQNQLAVAKDPETLLYAVNAGETMALMGVIVLSIVILGGFLATGGRPLPNYTYMVYCPQTIFVSTVAVGGLVLILSLIVGFLDIKSQYDLFIQSGAVLSGQSFPFPLLDLLMIVLAAASGAVMLLLGKNAYRGEELTACWLTLIPATLAVTRLIVIYRDYGSNPNFQDKFYPIIGTLFIALAFYQLSSAAYQKPVPVLNGIYSIASILFCGSVVASDLSIYDRMVTFGLNLYLLAFLGAILENTYSSRENYRTPPPPKGESFFTEKEGDITNSITQEDGIQ